MLAIIAIFRSLLAGRSPFVTVHSDMLYTPSSVDMHSKSYEYDPKGLDHAEITDTGPVFQNRPPSGGRIV